MLSKSTVLTLQQIVVFRITILLKTSFASVPIYKKKSNFTGFDFIPGAVLHIYCSERETAVKQRRPYVALPVSQSGYNKRTCSEYIDGYLLIQKVSQKSKSAILSANN